MIRQSTLKKLSEVLGLSISTVSRALKDHPDISDKTKAKVKELAVAMEYEPNSYAVQLRTKHTNVLGILVSSIDNFFTTLLSLLLKETPGYMVIRLSLCSRETTCRPRKTTLPFSGKTGWRVCLCLLPTQRKKSPLL